MQTMKSYLDARGLFCTVETDDCGREILFATDARCFVSCKVPTVNIGHEHGDAHSATEWATADSIDVVTRYLTSFLAAEYEVR